MNGIWENDGDTVYVNQSCTKEASDHRFTLRRRIEKCEQHGLEGRELNSERKVQILDAAPMLYLHGVNEAPEKVRIRKSRKKERKHGPCVVEGQKEDLLASGLEHC